VPRPPSHEITQLLQAWSSGDRAALDRLIPLVYDELRRLARSESRSLQGRPVSDPADGASFHLCGYS